MRASGSRVSTLFTGIIGVCIINPVTAVVGMTFNTQRVHVVLESPIAYLRLAANTELLE